MGTEVQPVQQATPAPFPDVQKFKVIAIATVLVDCFWPASRRKCSVK
jgi:hypothetical protein